MNHILIGHGTVGKEVEKILFENGINLEVIIRSQDSFDKAILGPETYVFICIPSKGTVEEIAHYYRSAFEKGSKIITCEKAFIAHHWEEILQNKELIKYSATVGGNSGILDAVAAQRGKIEEIKAVVNGTLNFIGEGGSYEEAISKGFAEPGARNLEEVIAKELDDVLYKTLILANHSGLYDRVIKTSDVKIFNYENGMRCSVFLNKNEIKAGFFEQNQFLYPEGVNNVLYINSLKAAEGPGAGGRATAERMFDDFKKLL